MKNEYFQNLESLPEDSTFDLSRVIDNLHFNDQGLIPVVTQCHSTLQVLMLAWMNKDALLKTLETGRVTYWSRSRQEYWIKGETSGHTQSLRSMRLDCDGDAVLCLVDQVGGACHTNRPHCFYLEVDSEKNLVRLNSQ